MSKWHPIETAPRDGRPILGYEPPDMDGPTADTLYVVRWEAKRNMWIEAGGEKYSPYRPTMWQPLPPLPSF
jgi:hypothetical protein